MSELLLAEEVCKLARVNRKALMRWCKLGLFPQPLRFGRTVRFDADAVAAALKSNRARP